MSGDVFPSITPDGTKAAEIADGVDARVFQVIARDAPLEYARKGHGGRIDGNSPAGLIAMWMKSVFTAAEAQALVAEARRVESDADADGMRFTEVLE